MEQGNRRPHIRTAIAMALGGTTLLGGCSLQSLESQHAVPNLPDSPAMEQHYAPSMHHESMNFSVDRSDKPTSTVITINTQQHGTLISPYINGANDISYDNGYGVANPKTERPYSQLVKDVQAMGLTIVRYPGGNPSDLFHWLNAVGPQNKRQPSLINGGNYPTPKAVAPSRFGPDEYGRFLDATGAAGDITVNFGTGTAQEAANWVCYMTAPVHDTQDPACDAWSALRAHNGHPKPYNIPYWEVGNEPYVDGYWRNGTVISSPGHCLTGQKVCLYVFGGTTEFTNQRVPNLQVESGVNNHVVGDEWDIVDAPIKPHSLQLHVQLPKTDPLPKGTSQLEFDFNEPWQEIPARYLSEYTLGNRVYAVNDTTGQIIFPRATDGSTLPSNAKVTASYISGPHQGFNTFYNDMKKADPSAHVCEAYPTVRALKLFGTKYKYDCVDPHYYGITGGDDGHNYSLLQYHNQVMLDSETFAERLQQLKQELAQYAGPRSKDIQEVVSEFGEDYYYDPKNTDAEGKQGSVFHRSVDMAVFVASMLANFIKHGVSVGEKHYLVSPDFSKVPGVQGAFDEQPFSSNAMIDATYPKCSADQCNTPTYVMQPTAEVYEMYKKLYDQLVPATISNDPEVTVSANQQDTNDDPRAETGQYKELDTVATTDGKGDEALLVINDAENKSVTAKIKTVGKMLSRVSAWTVGGSAAAYNTLQSPNTIEPVHVTSELRGDTTETFPPDSVTVLQLSKASGNTDEATLTSQK